MSDLTPKFSPWMLPAATAVAEAVAKLHELWKRKQHQSAGHA
ncbi:hypothetical protein [Massilia yuzhufengensis]|uniref:Uncharacterized protein n=1 Tax=Massilia yuzhufengensis TaxID=1164594 RepID=A0A1I1L665_9BURK|nr:hypothetical protein [Massilia yuzhufengensis]SFC66498.1 hypothetical protein SAMN05216204_108164 [Massilia yuzhufengensis]